MNRGRAARALATGGGGPGDDPTLRELFAKEEEPFPVFGFDVLVCDRCGGSRRSWAR